MGQRSDQKEESRSRILVSAGRGFRMHGYGGLGVDGLAKQAGVTSGAFYAHFKSKSEAFRSAIIAGMSDVRGGIQHLRATQGPGWRQAFIDFYLGDRRRADLADSCALQSLTGEVARADAATRLAYEHELRLVIDAAVAEPADETQRDVRAETIALLALLSGGVSLARAVEDPNFREEIIEAVALAARRLAPGPELDKVQLGARGRVDTASNV